MRFTRLMTLFRGLFSLSSTKIKMLISFPFRGWIVSLVLYPSTAEDCLSQFVCLTLSMDLCPQVCYPTSVYIKICQVINLVIRFSSMSSYVLHTVF